MWPLPWGMAILAQGILPEMPCAWIRQASTRILEHGVTHEDFFPPVLLSYGEEPSQAEDVVLGRRQPLPVYMSFPGVFCFEESRG